MNDPHDRYRSGEYATANPGWHAEDAAAKASAVLDALDAAGWAYDSVLDVGCGTGDVLAHLRDRLDARGRTDVRYEGWDPAAPSPRVDGLLAIRRGDPLVDRPRADVVLCLDVVEHVADTDAFLAAIGGLGHRFVFRLPLDLSVLDLVRPGRLIEARRRYGHVHAYTRATALATLRDAGFVVRHDAFHRVPPPTDTARRALVDAVRRGASSAAPRAAALWLGGFSLVVVAER